MFLQNAFVSLLLLLHSTNANLLIGVDELREVMATEKGVLKLVDTYVESEKARLVKLKEFSNTYRERIQTVAAVDNNNLSNPISAFLTIKQLLTDWTYVKDLLRHTSAEDFFRKLTEQRSQSRVPFPDNEDLEAAAVALLRLQDIYNVDTVDMANGQIAGVQQARELSALECYEIGRAAFNGGDHYHTVLWMQGALNRIQLEKQNTTANEADIVEHLAYSLHKTGNFERSLLLYKRLLELVPTHNKAALIVESYEKQVKVESVCRELPPLNNYNQIPEKDQYLSLCRLQQQSTVPVVSADNVRKLSCYYKRDRPFLLLAPIRTEVVHLKPIIHVFRNVMSSFEAKVLKGLSYPRFERSLVREKNSGQPLLALSRVAKSAWLTDSFNPIVKRLNKRIELMTNLNLATAEALQVTNYGLGGYYDPHFDFVRKDEPKYGSNGNRIATVLFYISQPEIGGATVFPRLNVTISPTALDAVLWYNIYASGEVDPSTIHAACPVLVGSKWSKNAKMLINIAVYLLLFSVATQFVSERGQEFTRPCDLSYDSYE